MPLDVMSLPSPCSSPDIHRPSEKSLALASSPAFDAASNWARVFTNSLGYFAFTAWKKVSMLT